MLFIITGSAVSPGTFNGISQGGPVTLGIPGNQFSALVSYTGVAGTSSLVGGNDVVLYNFMPVPEPATVLGLAATVLAGASWVRRRRTGSV